MKLKHTQSRCPRDGRPDEAIYEDLLRASRDLAQRTKGEPT